MSVADAALAGVPQPLLRAEGLRREFDVSRGLLDRLLAGEGRQVLRAVDGVSFSIAAGETFAIVGESGSGKSTVARMVAGLLPPSAGTVMLDGEPLGGGGRARLRRQRRRIQMIFQDPYASLDPRWRVADIVGEPLSAFGLASGAEARTRVDALLGLVGLSAADGARHPHAFSGGQRQRIAIARALAAESEVVICDEPTSALDVSVQAQILNLMRDLQDRLGLTYLFISHNLAVVRHMARRIGVMYAGRLVEEASSRALFAAPRHPYTRMLLAAVPDVSFAGRAPSPPAGEPPDPIRPPPGCPFHPRCPLAFDRCRREMPPLVDGVACWAAERG